MSKVLKYLILLSCCVVFFDAFAQKKRRFTRKKFPLFEVEVSSDVDLSEIVKRIAKKQYLIFPVKYFKNKKIKKFAVFYVLDEDKEGVLAEIVAQKLIKKSQYVVARIVRLGKNVTANDLVGYPVVRLQDLQKSLNQGPNIRDNPLVKVSFGFGQLIRTAANVLTGQKINVRSNDSVGSISGFLPVVGGGRWTNWFGARFSSHSVNEGFFKIAGAGNTGSVQDGSVVGGRTDLEIIFQPYFRNLFLLHNLSVIYATHQIYDAVSLTSSRIIGGGTSETTRSFSSISLGGSLNPFPSVFIGGRYVNPLTTEFTVITNDPAYSNTSFPGLWSESHIYAWITLTPSIFSNIQTSFSVALDIRTDFVELPGFGSEIDHFLQDTSVQAKASIAYLL